MHEDNRSAASRNALPLEARRALWRKLWDRLLAPEDLRDPDEILAHQRKDASIDSSDGSREAR